MGFSTRQDSGAVLSEINITPLVDVMLVLLVAFMVTVPVMNNAIKVELPKTVASNKASDEKPVVITVDKDKRVYVDQVDVGIEALPKLLHDLKAARPELGVHLQADETVPYGPVAKVMAIIESTGVSRVSVLTTQ
ncbi:biopolymer transporter ExbD [Chitinimonas sp. BJYL2]|uniref:ExbD/TolR family protein n=1 Tax=Chitinimonas sp. BJYL2 TaxID=2976696 RepID=UPI0022B39997|nr:biopolymer transporter ExbD [Chitinimonas sp. BJYL2]